MLRNQDFYCEICEARWEELLRVEDNEYVEHCGKPAKKLAMAPAVKYVAPHFNKALGKHIKDSRHFDKELAKGDYFVPTTNEIARAVENPHGMGGPPKPDKKRIRAAAEKAYSLLHATGKV